MSDGNLIAVTFPDGCVVAYDILRSELMLNGKGTRSSFVGGGLPARPIKMVTTARVVVGGGMAPEKVGMMTKLGWQKTIFGADSWQPRFF